MALLAPCSMHSTLSTKHLLFVFALIMLSAQSKACLANFSAPTPSNILMSARSNSSNSLNFSRCGSFSSSTSLWSKLFSNHFLSGFNPPKSTAQFLSSRSLQPNVNLKARLYPCSKWQCEWSALGCLKTADRPMLCPYVLVE